jgi:phosphoribosyl 1,2-cyclic phosphodiesterase
MIVRLWGTRGSLAAPGVETARYGGNTSCVEVRGANGGVLVLDAGTGVRRLGAQLPKDLRRIDILLTHLHMDHVQGLGFFDPLYRENLEIHMWGPASPMAGLRARLMRYLSPPLFPVHLRDLPCSLTLHQVPCSPFEIGEFKVSASLICHPGPTVGYRIESPAGVLAYLPDHEPALGVATFPNAGEWTSGYSLAVGADILIHDSQYTADEYRQRVGWGHSAVEQTVTFAELAKVGHLVTFHHDPSHDDWALDQLTGYVAGLAKTDMAISPGTEGAVFELDKASAAASPNGGERAR